MNVRENHPQNADTKMHFGLIWFHLASLLICLRDLNPSRSNKSLINYY
jgi:hypothetical protein